MGRSSHKGGPFLRPSLAFLVKESPRHICKSRTAICTAITSGMTERPSAPEQEYSFAVDAFTQQRVLKLRDEIAVLRCENGVYRSQTHHSLEQRRTNDLRRFRLFAIREELRSLSQSGWHVGGLAGKMRER